MIYLNGMFGNRANYNYIKNGRRKFLTLFW